MAGTGGHFGPESVACFAPEWVVAFSGILNFIIDLPHRPAK